MASEAILASPLTSHNQQRPVSVATLPQRGRVNSTKHCFQWSLNIMSLQVVHLKRGKLLFNLVLNL